MLLYIKEDFRTLFSCRNTLFRTRVICSPPRPDSAPAFRVSHGKTRLYKEYNGSDDVRYFRKRGVTHHGARAGYPGFTQPSVQGSDTPPLKNEARRKQQGCNVTFEAIPGFVDIITGICLRHNPRSLPGSGFLIHPDEIHHGDFFPDLPGFSRSDEAGTGMLRYPSPVTPPVRFGTSKIVIPPARDLMSVTEHRSSPLRDWRVFLKIPARRRAATAALRISDKTPLMHLILEEAPCSPVGS
jgi:hypothetical protein